MVNYSIPNPLNPTYGGDLDARKNGITTLEQLKNWDIVANPIPNGFNVYFDGVNYQYDSNNEVNETTGKFAVFAGGGEIPDNSIAEVKLDEGVKTKLNSSVQFIEQKLTTAQQAQARANIGVNESGGTDSAVLYTEQNLTNEQKDVAKENIDISGITSKLQLDPIGNLVNPNTITPNTYANIITGNLQSNSSYFTTDFIELTTNVSYNIGAESNASYLARFVAVYDENKVVISEQGGENLGVITIVGNARFVRLSANNNNNLFLRVAPHDTYVPYGIIIGNAHLSEDVVWDYTTPKSITTKDVMDESIANIVDFVKDELSSVIQDNGIIQQTWKEIISYNFLNTTSTFSGWGWVVDGMDREMSGIQFRIINRDTKPITQVRACIRKGAKDAELLWEKTIDVNIGIAGDEYVNIFFDNLLYFEDEVLFVSYQTNALSTRYGGSAGDALVKYQPENGYSNPVYWTSGSMENTFGANVTGNSSYASYYAFIEKSTDISDKQINYIAKELLLPTPDFLAKLINLPDRIHAVQNDVLQLFYRGIIDDSKLYSKYALHFSCDVGRNTNRYWEMIDDTVGTYLSQMVVRDSDLNIIAKKDVSIVINPTPVNPATKQHILCVGDSLTSGGIWVTEGQRRLTESGGTPEALGLDNNLIKTIGRKGNNIANWEGTGGWTWSSYTNAGNIAYRFNVINITEPVRFDTMYSVGDLILVVREINITNGVGDIMMSLVSGTGEPPVSGILTLSSSSTGTQQSIEYNSFENDVTNPFWDKETNEMDFISYINQYGDGQLDVVYTLLTWNGQTPNKTDFSDIEISMVKFMSVLKEQYPNVKLKLMGIQLPSLNGGLGLNYGANLNANYVDQDAMIKTVFNMNNFYQEFANRAEYVDWVEFINVSAQFDSEYNMPYREDAVNTRSTITERIGTNGVHPSNEGYLQIGDIFYRSLANYLSEL